MKVKSKNKKNQLFDNEKLIEQLIYQGIFHIKPKSNYEFGSF